MALTVAVVGTGYWGRNHVRTLAALRDEGTIAALVVCDLDEERAKSLAREFGCVWETDAAKLATKHSVTAATIATPTPQHASLAISLMEQGVNVLVEKPLAMNENEAKSVLDAAQRTGRVLMVGHLFRYHAAVRKAAELIAEGALGPVLHIESERLSVREPRPDIGVIAALGIHDMDITCDLMGDIDPIKIRAIALPSDEPGIEDHAVLKLEFPGGAGGNPDGVTAIVTVSWRSRIQGKVRELRVIGRDASLAIDYLDHAGLWIHHHPGNARGQQWGGFDAAPRERVDIPLGEPSLTAELRAFILHSSGADDSEPLASGQVGLHGVRLVDAALRAADE
jgi:UDP-N-acetylglucosamine 3-dehydrogenase